jgi:hypothetical protein
MEFGYANYLILLFLNSQKTHLVKIKPNQNVSFGEPFGSFLATRIKHTLLYVVKYYMTHLLMMIYTGYLAYRAAYGMVYGICSLVAAIIYKPLRIVFLNDSIPALSDFLIFLFKLSH